VQLLARPCAGWYMPCAHVKHTFSSARGMYQPAGHMKVLHTVSDVLVHAACTSFPTPHTMHRSCLPALGPPHRSAQ
jgi:hypothetical protein